jgi:hypothetical protein
MTLREAEPARRSHSKAEAERRQRQRAQSDPARDRAQALALMERLNDDAVLTFAQWICLLGIGARTGRRILRNGHGPPIVWLSERRMGIRVGAHRAWLAAREGK